MNSMNRSYFMLEDYQKVISEKHITMTVTKTLITFLD